MLDIAGLLEHVPSARIEPAWLGFFAWEEPAKPVLARLAEGGWEIERKDESAWCTRCEGQGGGFNFAGDSWQCNCHGGKINDVTILGQRGTEKFRRRWLWDGEAWENRYGGEASPPPFRLLVIK